VELALGEDAVLAENRDRIGRDQVGEAVDGGPAVRQAPPLGLLAPGLGIVVAVEDDVLRLGDDLGQERLDLGVEVLVDGDGLLDRGDHVVDRLGDDRVEHDVRPSDRLARPDGAELELVASEGERAGPVTVAGVAREGGVAP
jgi:hypothetical protein